MTDSLYVLLTLEPRGNDTYKSVEDDTAELDEIGCSVPGTLVASLLTSADPSKPVQATVGVDATSHQLRRVALVGPFFDKAQSSTFTVVLDNYGENVTITPPAG